MNTEPVRVSLWSLRREAARCRRAWRQCEDPEEHARLATDLAQAEEAVRVYLEGRNHVPQAHP